LHFQNAIETEINFFVKGLFHKRLNDRTKFTMNIAGSFTLVNETLKLNCSGHEFDYYKPVVKQRQDYCPFGMQMAGRSFTSGDGYRYGFNGMERDDEVKGSGNHMAFSGYGLDTRLGRRLNTDPLEIKYPNSSPYAVNFNNPIYYLDPDGKEGVAAIDNKNKTITIKAVYHTQTVPTGNMASTAYSSKEMQSMQNNMNSTLNGLGHTVSEGQYKGYKVQFDLQFKEGGQPYELNNKASKETFKGVSIGNTFQGGDDKSYPNLFTGSEPDMDGTITNRGGVTQDHKNIVMNREGETERNQIHEVFHTLFFDNDDAKKGIGSYNRSDLPNQDDINTLINNDALPKVEVENE